VAAVEELQAELQETNRGVVALYAELEANADSLRQAEDRLRLLLDSVQDYAICMLTPDGLVASWNVGAERLFAHAAPDILARHFGCFYTDADRERDLAREHLRQASENGRLACECLQLRRGSVEFFAHVVITPVRRAREGELRGFSLVVRDITERKRLEDDLHQRAEELAAANRAKEAFLATLSHELRTPLNAMLGWTRLLRLGKLDAAGSARALDTIERNAHVQEQLIADILDVSRIVTGRLRLDLRPLTLGPVVAAAVDAVRPAAEAKRIGIDVRTELEAAVLGDPDRLQQILWNLLVNAVKFTPEGGRITVSVAADGPRAVITVTDTGEGIAPDLLPRVFERFTQGDASVTRLHGGLGLGLSIVRHLVELHGGEVRAASEGEGRGATFSVRLPLRAVRQAVSESASAPVQLLSGVKVLVVDDEADVRQIVSLALTQCGARTAAVASAREALRMMAEFMPDVVVSDIGMPGEDGCSFIRRLRATGASGIGDVPAVALTASCQPEDRTRALSAGFQQFVPKPVGMDELAAIVRTLAHSRSH
jgi:PAS domain S-box-containing protein